MRQLLCLIFAVIGAIVCIATTVSATPAPQPSILNQDLPERGRAIMGWDGVRAHGLVIRHKSKQQVWFDDRQQRQKPQRVFWAWPLPTNQRVCVTLLTAPKKTLAAKIRVFLPNPTLSWPDLTPTVSPQCFDASSTEPIPQPTSNNKATAKTTTKASAPLDDTVQIKTWVRQHWSVMTQAQLVARRANVLGSSTIRVEPDKKIVFSEVLKKNEHFQNMRRRTQRYGLENLERYQRFVTSMDPRTTIKPSESVPDATRWLVLSYNGDALPRAMDSMIWRVSFEKKTPAIDLPVGFSTTDVLGASWRVYADTPHYWSKYSLDGKVSDLKYHDKGLGFRDRLFSSDLDLLQDSVVSDIGLRMMSPELPDAKTSLPFHSWPRFARTGVYGRFFVTKKRKHISCKQMKSRFYVEPTPSQGKTLQQTVLDPSIKLERERLNVIRCVSVLKWFPRQHDQHAYRLIMLDDVQGTYQKGVLIQLSDFNQKLNSQWLPRARLGLPKRSQEVAKNPVKSTPSSGCNAVPVRVPGTLLVLLIGGVFVVPGTRKKATIVLISTLVLMCIHVDGYSRKIVLKSKRPAQLKTPFQLIEVPDDVTKFNGLATKGSICGRYHHAEFKKTLLTMNTWEVICVSRSPQKADHYIQVMALPPSQHTYAKNKPASFNPRISVEVLDVSVKHDAEVAWFKAWKGRRSGVMHQFEVKDVRLFVPSRGVNACRLANRWKNTALILQLQSYKSLCELGWQIVVATYKRSRKATNTVGLSHSGVGKYILLPGIDVTLNAQTLKGPSKFMAFEPSLAPNTKKKPDTSGTQFFSITADQPINREVFGECFVVSSLNVLTLPTRKYIYTLLPKPCATTVRSVTFLDPRSEGKMSR